MVAVAAPFLFVCCASFVAAEETNDGGWLRPGYHFTRERYHMNDPNGLMWRRDQEDELRYHMFFQSTDPDQKGPHSQWGHTVSPDLVHFKRLPRTPIRGSSGGGVALPPGFVPPPQLAGAKAITINSAPDSPSLSPPTGLHLWYSSDEQLLNWTIFRNASRVQSSNNLTCVICPDLVPSSLNPGYIGDNYVWVETQNETTGTAEPTSSSGTGGSGGGGGSTAAGGKPLHTFYVLSGSTKCAPDHPWCSYVGLGGNATAQSLLFRSTDLLHWEFVSQFTGQEVVGGKPQQHIDTPDTFPLNDKTQASVPSASAWPAPAAAPGDRPPSAAGENNGNATQAFVWLSQGGLPTGKPCRTIWQVGALDNATNTFVPKLRPKGSGGGPVQVQETRF